MPQTILIIEDNLYHRKTLAKIIKESTNLKILTARNGAGVLYKIENIMPDIILLDIIMPELDGYYIAKELKNNQKTKDIPIIFLTIKDSVTDKLRAFEIGGVDYVTKPFHKEELLARINTHLRIKQLQEELKIKNAFLEDRELHLTKLVEERTKKIERITLAMIKTLENANLFNDFDTGNHLKRVSEYSSLIAEKYGCGKDFINKLKMYVPLHDIGKIGIRDNILKKPGRFTPEEFKEMQKHVIIGVKILGTEEVEDVAKNIVLYHHEKWDGTGYIYKLKEERIPIEARIAALSDVFDALVTQRIYKPAYTPEEAKEIIIAGSNKHFDPDLVKIFLDYFNNFKEIRNSFI